MRGEAAAERLDAGDRLGDQPVGAGGGDPLAVLAHGIGGQRHDRHLRAGVAAGADRADHVEAGEPRHLDVDHHEVEPAPASKRSSASTPSAQTVTSALSARSICDATIWLVGLSSASSTRRPARSDAGGARRPARPGRRRPRAGSAAPPRRRRRGGCRARARRPARSASVRTISSPRPVAGRGRTGARGRLSAASPGPSSATRKTTLPSAARAERQAHGAGVAELERVADEVVEHPRQRHRIETQGRRARPPRPRPRSASPRVGGLGGVAAAEVREEARRVSTPSAAGSAGSGSSPRTIPTRPASVRDAAAIRSNCARASASSAAASIWPAAADHAHQRPADVVAQHRQLAAFEPRAGRALAPVQKWVDDGHVVLAPATRPAAGSLGVTCG